MALLVSTLCSAAAFGGDESNVAAILQKIG
jgi:hypothetical protein